MPGSPLSRKRRPRPAKASSRPASSSASSRSRPTNEPPGASARRRGVGASSPGSCRRIACVELAQLAAGLDAELVDERRRAPPGRPRAPRPGGRSGRGEHQLAAQALPQRMLARSAPRARRRARRGGRARGRRRSAARARRAAAPRAARSPPARTARRRGRRAAARATARAPRAASPPPSRDPRARGLGDEPLEAVEVELGRVDAQHVAGRARDQLGRRRAACAAARRRPGRSCRPSRAATRPTARRSAARSRRPRWRAAAAARAATAACHRRARAGRAARPPPTGRGDGTPHAASTTHHPARLPPAVSVPGIDRMGRSQARRSPGCAQRITHRRRLRGRVAALLARGGPAGPAQPDTRDAAARFAERTVTDPGFPAYPTAAQPGEFRQDLRSPDTRDVVAGRGTFSAPDVTVVRVPQPAPAPARRHRLGRRRHRCRLHARAGGRGHRCGPAPRPRTLADRDLALTWRRLPACGGACSPPWPTARATGGAGSACDRRACGDGPAHRRGGAQPAVASSSSREASLTRGRRSLRPRSSSCCVDRVPAARRSRRRLRARRAARRSARVAGSGSTPLRRSSARQATVSSASRLLVPRMPVGPRLIQPTV